MMQTRKSPAPVGLRLTLASLRARLLSLVLLLLIPAILLALLSAAEQRARDQAAAETEALRFARLAATTQGQQLAAVRQLLSALAELPAVRQRDSQACNPYFAALLEAHPAYSNLSVVDLNGTDFFCSAIPAASGVNVTDRAWFQRVLQTRTFAVGDYIVGRTTGVASISFAHPVLDEAGELDSIAVVSVHLDWLSRWLGEIDLPPDSTLLILDHNGVIIARYPYDEAFIGASIPPDLFERVQAARDATLVLPGVDGKMRFYGITMLPDLTGNIYMTVGLSRDIALAESNRLQNALLFGLFAVVGAMLVLGWAGGERFITRPTRRLVSATERLAQGDLRARVELPHSIDELDRLADSINQLAEALETRAAEVRHYTEELQTEIELRKQTELQLEDLIRALMAEIAAREAAQDADERKLRFLAMVSHELKTPLASIKGFATTLLAKDVRWNADEQAGFLEVIDAESDVLLEMLERLLDLSRIESGVFMVQPDDVDMGRLFIQFRPHLEAVAPNHPVTFDIPERPLPLRADAPRIRQVLVNLVSNAAKYSPDGAPIQVAASAAGDCVRVDVTDCGTGIPPEERENIFKPFNRGQAHLVKAKGVGLGLAICRGIIEAHGGRLWLSASSEQGSTFSFELPAVSVPLAELEHQAE